MLERTSAPQGRWPSCEYRQRVIAALDLLALGRFDQDAATTMAAVLVSVVLLAYWILKT